MNVHAVDKPLNYFSNDYTTYYPLIPPGQVVLNPGGAVVLTLEQLQKENVSASYVGSF